MTITALRERWGGAILPSIRLDRNNSIERWDGASEGPAWCINFEGFGFTGCIFIGRTPPKREG